MAGNGMRSPRWFATTTIAFVVAAAAWAAPAGAADTRAHVPAFDGQWGRDMLFF